MSNSNKIMKVSNVITKFGDKLVHNGINLHVNEGEIYGLLGPSGCGKSVLMREMIMLEQIRSGSIELLGHKIESIGMRAAQKLRLQWGVLFQSNALFTSLTVAENIALALQEYTRLSQESINDIVAFKIDIVGLKQSDGMLYPSQISGGMKKKAALARALVMDPKIVFLDEPTSGLDPISAREFDTLIVKLRDLLNLTVVMVSHDLTSINTTLDRMAVIDNKKIVAEGTLTEVKMIESPFIERFFEMDKGKG
ncbi:ATP-binding cassette domain-containing protein [Sulfurimonas sp. HSL3-7]|uniref:ABC transporter ATP-binding protein n=1 Tax=Sulfonitrofixus jiaomeiensis TaxID=3131938 RepID=UPI0031F9100E